MEVRWHVGGLWACSVRATLTLPGANWQKKKKTRNSWTWWGILTWKVDHQEVDHRAVVKTNRASLGHPLTWCGTSIRKTQKAQRECWWQWSRGMGCLGAKVMLTIVYFNHTSRNCFLLCFYPQYLALQVLINIGLLNECIEITLMITSVGELRKKPQQGRIISHVIQMRLNLSNNINVIHVLYFIQ